MKKIIILTVAMLFVASAAFAVISGTAHDLSALGGGAPAQICVYCHTPHNAAAPAAFAPLWSHSNTAETFILYGSTPYAGSDLNGTVQADIGPVSKACMSCHDGVVKTGEIANGYFTGSYGAAMGGDPALGADLKNDHPVGITYQSDLDLELNDPTAFTNVQLFDAASGAVSNIDGSLVECSSCHDVHDNTNSPFLLVANTNSALCLECHNK